MTWQGRSGVLRGDKKMKPDYPTMAKIVASLKHEN